MSSFALMPNGIQSALIDLLEPEIFLFAEDTEVPTPYFFFEVLKMSSRESFSLECVVNIFETVPGHQSLQLLLLFRGEKCLDVMGIENVCQADLQNFRRQRYDFTLMTEIKLGSIEYHVVMGIDRMRPLPMGVHQQVNLRLKRLFQSLVDTTAELKILLIVEKVSHYSFEQLLSMLLVRRLCNAAAKKKEVPFNPLLGFGSANPRDERNTQIGQERRLWLSQCKRHSMIPIDDMTENPSDLAKIDRCQVETRMLRVLYETELVPLNKFRFEADISTQLKIDSLDRVILLVAIEHQFSTVFEDTVFEGVRTLDEIATILSRDQKIL